MNTVTQPQKVVNTETTLTEKQAETLQALRQNAWAIEGRSAKRVYSNALAIEFKLREKNLACWASLSRLWRGALLAAESTTTTHDIEFDNTTGISQHNGRLICRVARPWKDTYVIQYTDHTRTAMTCTCHDHQHGGFTYYAEDGTVRVMCKHIFAAMILIACDFLTPVCDFQPADPIRTAEDKLKASFHAAEQRFSGESAPATATAVPQVASLQPYRDYKPAKAPMCLTHKVQRRAERRQIADDQQKRRNRIRRGREMTDMSVDELNSLLVGV